MTDGKSGQQILQGSDRCVSQSKGYHAGNRIYGDQRQLRGFLLRQGHYPEGRTGQRNTGRTEETENRLWMSFWIRYVYWEGTLMTMNKIMGKLRRHNKNQYTLLGICVFLSVLLVTSFTLMYFSPTVQGLLPEGEEIPESCHGL